MSERLDVAELVAAEYSSGKRRKVKAKQVVTVVRSLRHGLPREVVAPAQKMTVETLDELVALYETKLKEIR